MRLADGEYELTVAPALRNSFRVTLRRTCDRAGVVTWIDPKVYDLMPKAACRMTAAQIIDLGRFLLAVERVAYFLELECRQVRPQLRSDG